MASWRFPLSYIPHPALVFGTVHIITHYAFSTSNASQLQPIFLVQVFLSRIHVKSFAASWSW